jgi:hypothetical protein
MLPLNRPRIVIFQHYSPLNLTSAQQWQEMQGLMFLFSCHSFLMPFMASIKHATQIDEIHPFIAKRLSARIECLNHSDTYAKNMNNSQLEGQLFGRKLDQGTFMA